MFRLTQGWRQNTPPTLGSVMQPLRGRYFCKKYAALGETAALLNGLYPGIRSRLHTLVFMPDVIKKRPSGVK
jgi:hypothetical protein